MPATPAPPAPPKVSGFLTRPKDELRWPPKLAPPGFRQPIDQAEREEWLARKVSKDTVDAAGTLGERAPLLPSPPPPEEKKRFARLWRAAPSCSVPQSWQPPSERGMPIMRRDSSAHNNDRPKREIHPPKQDLPFNDPRLKKKEEHQAFAYRLTPWR